MATLDRLAPPPVSAPSVSAWSPRRAIAAAVIMAAAIAALQVFQSSGFANAGQEIQRLQQEERDSQARVHDLEAEVAALSSLERVERQARERLGMIPPKGIVYVEVAVPAPDKPLLPRPIVSGTASAATPSAAWWQRVLRAFPIP